MINQYSYEGFSNEILQIETGDPLPPHELTQYGDKGFKLLGFTYIRNKVSEGHFLYIFGRGGVYQ